MAKRKKLTRAQLTAMLRRLDQAAPAKKKNVGTAEKKRRRLAVVREKQRRAQVKNRAMADAEEKRAYVRYLKSIGKPRPAHHGRRQNPRPGPQQWRGGNRKVRRAQKTGNRAKEQFQKDRSFTRAYKTPGHGIQARPSAQNPAKLRAVKGSTGWMKATAVRFLKRGGKTVVLVRKPARKRGR